MTHNIYGSDIGSLVKGFKHATQVIHMEHPDYIFAPIVGAVPFIDIFSLVDRKFPLDEVEYLPNSSRFGNRDELMRKWYENFYSSVETGERMKIVCVDEVLSGSSAVKGYKQFQKSLEDRAGTKLGEDFTRQDYLDCLNDLRKKISYHILGIAELGHDLNKKFKGLVNKKLANIINFDDVPTIDDVRLNPVRLKVERMNGQGRAIYAPEIEKFEFTSEYMAFMQNIAQYVGRDPAQFSPVNLSKIQQGLERSREE